MVVKLSKYLSDYSMSMKKVFLQLSDIKILTIDGEKSLYKALTKKQKDILDVFDGNSLLINFFEGD